MHPRTDEGTYGAMGCNGFRDVGKRLAEGASEFPPGRNSLSGRQAGDS